MKKIKLIPAILARHKTEFKKQWTKVAPLSSFIQIDLADGRLVKPKTNLQPNDIKALTKNHQIELHLMVKNVDSYIMTWLKLPNVKRIIWHHEALPDKDVILCLNDFLKQKKIKPGLSLNPETPLSKIDKLVPYFDLIQVMGVHPGKQGQTLQNKTINKIKKLRQNYPQLDIEIDGGVNQANFTKLKKAGANQFILGSYLQNAIQARQAFKQLK